MIKRPPSGGRNEWSTYRPGRALVWDGVPPNPPPVMSSPPPTTTALRRGASGLHVELEHYRELPFWG